MTDTPAVAPTEARGEQAPRFPVEVAGYSGSLDQLVARAQRGEVDLDAVAVAEITRSFRAQLEAPGAEVDLREVADFLSLAARLVSLKAARLNPSARAGDDDADTEPAADDPGRRLSEYRLFKAAADALLAEASEEGARSFLGLVAPEVIPVERLRIPPERLAAAFREVLARLSDAEPLPVGSVTFSVDEKMVEISELLSTGPLEFHELFAAVTTRLEAVACFLALLELLRLGRATVAQQHPYGAITVRAGG